MNDAERLSHDPVMRAIVDHSFRNNEVRLQLHALAYNLGNFLRTLGLAPRRWSIGR